MVGKYDIEVRQRKLVYKLSVKRNITVITGNSATGKTKLLELISAYNALGNESGVIINCERPCITLTGKSSDVRRIVEQNAGSIFFMDEDYTRLMKTTEFADIVKHADGYFVLVTRDKLSNLPYSINAIMYLTQETKYNEYKPKVTVNIAAPKYLSKMPDKAICPDALLLEDSKCGYQFFQEFLRESCCLCISADGKSNIPSIIEHYKDIEENMLVVVDAAAFGAELFDTIKAINHKRTLKVFIYMPESFEYLLLKAGIIKCENTDVLEHTEEYAESSRYFSWERYFEAYAKEMCNAVGTFYSKSKISEWCITDSSLAKMKKVLPQNICINPK